MAAVLPALVGVVAYRGSFSVPFLFDDTRSIVDNPAIRLTTLDWRSLWAAGGTGRQLAYLSFALNHYFGGLNVTGYHAVNLVVHLLNAFLVVLLARKVTSLAVPGLEDARRWSVAIGTAALFVAHPIHVQAVTYVVQRMASMGATFGLTATILYLEGRTAAGARRRALLLVGAGGSAAAAFFCKESYLALPGVAVVTGAVLFSDFRPSSRRGRLALAAFLAASAVVAVGAYLRNRDALVSHDSLYGLSLTERALTNCRVIFLYASQLLLPRPGRFHLDWDYPVSTTLLSPLATLPAVLGLAGLAGVAAWQWTRRPIISFAIVWFLGNLAVEQSIIPLDLVAEHRVYFPSFGLLLLASHALCAGARRAGFSAAWVLVPVTAALVTWTNHRNELWQDPVRVWEDVVSNSPNLTRGYFGLGGAYRNRGDLAGAEAAFRKVVELAPQHATGHNNLGNVLRERGKLEEAEAEWMLAAKLGPQLAAPVASLAWLRSAQGRLGEAEQLLHQVIALEPRSARAHLNLGDFYLRNGLPAPAVASLSAAIGLNPGDAGAHLQRARAYAAMKDGGRAIEDYRRSLTLDPGQAEARAELAALLQTRDP